MKRLAPIALFATAVLAAISSIAAADVPLAPGAVVRQLATGFRFTEGPVWGPDGALYFSDIPNERIHKILPDGTVAIHRERSGGANGLKFDARGRLVACEGKAGRLSLDDLSGNVTALAGSFEGKPFNSPNDLWIAPGGGIFFTDPRYGKDETLPQEGMHAYHLDPATGAVCRIASDLVRPNGIVGTPDGERLYIADHGAGKVWAYRIAPGPSLEEKRLVAEHPCDGMTLDERGNLYLTAGPQVVVVGPGGEALGAIDVPEAPSNVAFGGPGGSTLFITARTSVYAVEMSVRGAGSP